MTDRDEEILKMPIDEEELEQVSGGFCIISGAFGNGGCIESYYTMKCDATVEAGSHCYRNDYCLKGKHIKYDNSAIRKRKYATDK